jgi:hypothetical protein
MWSFILLFLFLVFIFYELIRRPIICKRKIYEHIRWLGGEVDSIEKMSSRESIYCVYYKIDGLSKTAVVKFGFFYDEDWK